MARQFLLFSQMIIRNKLFPSIHVCTSNNGLSVYKDNWTYFNSWNNAWLISIKAEVTCFKIRKKIQHQDPNCRCLSPEVILWSEYLPWLSATVFQVCNAHRMTKYASKKAPNTFFHIKAFLTLRVMFPVMFLKIISPFHNVAQTTSMLWNRTAASFIKTLKRSLTLCIGKMQTGYLSELPGLAFPSCFMPAFFFFPTSLTMLVIYSYTWTTTSPKKPEFYL